MEFDVDEIHLLIDIDEDEAYVQDPIQRDRTSQTKVGEKVKLRPGVWVELSEKKHIRLMGMIPFEIEFLPKEQQEKGRMRDEFDPFMAKIREDYYKKLSTTKYFPSPVPKSHRDRHRPHQVPDTAPRSVRGSVHRDQQVIVDDQTAEDERLILGDEPLEPTLSIASLTQEANYASQYSESPDTSAPPSYDIKQGRILPQELLRSNRVVISPNTTSNRSGSSRISSVDHDAPTQLMVDSSDGLSSENTQLLYDSQIATLRYDASELLAVQAVVSPVIPETQRVSSTQRTSPDRVSLRATKKFSEPLVKEEDHSIGATPLTTTATTSTTITQSARPPSRQLSAEPTSQEVSQIVSSSPPAQVHDFDEMVPSTPAEDIGVPSGTSRDSIPNTDPRTSPPADPALEDCDKVSGTPEEKRYTAMSEISAFETRVNTSEESISARGSPDPLSSSIKPEEDEEKILSSVPVKKESTRGSLRSQGSMQKSKQAQSVKTTTTTSTTRDEQDDDTTQSGASESERDDEPPLIRNRKDRPVISARKVSSSSSGGSRRVLSGAKDDKSTEGASAGRSSSRSKEGSPKHGIDSDDETERRPKPGKMIKTTGTNDDMTTTTTTTTTRTTRRQNTNDAAVTSTLIRASSSRTLLRGRSAGDMEKPTVIISAPRVSEDEKRSYQKIVDQLAGPSKPDIKTVSVLVSDGSSRTSKVLCAIARGVPIVSVKWLEDSKANLKFVRWDDYLLNDSELEHKYQFNLAETCEKARSNPEGGTELFRKYSFHIVTLKPSKGKGKALMQDNRFITKLSATNDLTPMIEVCGGKIHKGEPKDADRDHVIIIGPDAYCETSQAFIERRFHVMKRDFITNSIIHQRVDLDKDVIEPQAEPTTQDAHGDEEGGLASDEEEEDHEGYEEDTSMIFPRPDSRGKRAARSPTLSRSTSTVSTTGNSSILSGRLFDESGVLVSPPSPTSHGPSHRGGGRRGSTATRRTKSVVDEDDPMNEAPPPPPLTTTSATSTSSSQARSGRSTIGRSNTNQVSEEESDQVKPAKATPKTRRAKSSSSMAKPSTTDTEENDTAAADADGATSTTTTESTGKAAATTKRSTQGRQRKK